MRGAAVDLPNWVVEELARVTRPANVAPALQALGEATEAFGAGRYPSAVRKATRAKELAPRDATVRETLGLAAYRSGDWNTGLRELRTYRRMTGTTDHLPVEMDILRALDRPEDVEKAWRELEDRGGRPGVLKEGRVVFASHLIDRGSVEEAWRLTSPRRLTNEPHPEDLRVWYVAARSAAILGDAETARTIRNAILEADPAFPGIDELEALIVAAGTVG